MARRKHKEQCYERREQRNQSLKTLMDYLDEQLLGTLNAIQKITEEEGLSDAEKVERIRLLLEPRNANRHWASALLMALKVQLETELSEDDYYRHWEAQSLRIQNRISPIVKALTFQGEPGAKELLNAIQYFKDKDGSVDKNAPLEFLKPVERKVVIEDGCQFRVSLYKALLFLHIQSAIKSGTLNLKHSYKYRPLDNYLIERERWCRDKDILLERAGLQSFTDPQQVLSELDEALHQQYLTTNQNILEGKNPFVTLAQKGK